MVRTTLRKIAKCLNTMNQVTIDSIASRIGLEKPSCSKHDADFPKHVSAMVSNLRQRNPSVRLDDVRGFMMPAMMTAGLFYLPKELKPERLDQACTLTLSCINHWTL